MRGGARVEPKAVVHQAPVCTDCTEQHLRIMVWMMVSGSVPGVSIQVLPIEEPTVRLTAGSSAMGPRTNNPSGAFRDALSLSAEIPNRQVPRGTSGQKVRGLIMDVNP